MKNIIKIFIALILIASVSGCEDFLETVPSDAISDDNMYTDVSGAQFVLSGVYREMRQATQNTGGGVMTTLRHCMAVYGDDMNTVRIGNSFNYYADHEYNYHLINTSSSASALNWRHLYKIIANCNSIIVNVDESNGDQATKDHVKGQAIAIRSYYYFWLVRLFAPPVDSELGVPLYETVNITGNPRSTVGEVYTKIITDFNTAIGLLDGYDRSHKHYINKSVAQGMLAYVYLTHEDWDLAASTALAARTGYPLSNREEFRSGQNDENLAEWMWCITQQEDQKNPWSTLPKYWGTYGGVDPAYKTWPGRWFISKTLSEEFEPTDVRHQFYDYKEYIIEIVDGDTAYCTASDKFWESRRAEDYMMGDVAWMRSAEMYLIEAEGRLRGSDPTGALTVLNELQTTREATPTAATLDNILLERRKELYGEGYSYFDLIRNGLPVVRTVPNRCYTGMPANDWSWLQQIPVDEITTNPSINEEHQNPIEGSYR